MQEWTTRNSNLKKNVNNMIYGLDSSTAKRQEANLELAEIRFSVSVASLDRIVNEYI